MIQLRRLQKGRRWRAERGKKVKGAWRGGSKVESEVISYPDPTCNWNFGSGLAWPCKVWVRDWVHGKEARIRG